MDFAVLNGGDEEGQKDWRQGPFFLKTERKELNKRAQRMGKF